MAMLIYLLICITISSLYPSDAYKVLVATQMPSKSHSILNDGIVRQLLKDGNEVTYIRSIEYKNAPPTLRQIDVSSNAHAIPAGTLNIKAIMDKTAKNNSFKGKRLMTTVGIKTLENKDVQKLLSDPKEHFDVVIVEFMDNDVLASFAAVFDCPLIWMSPIETNSDILRRIEAVPNPAHVPNCKSRNIAPLNFWQRVEELWSLLQSEYLYFRYFNDMETEAYNRLIAPIIAKRGRQPPPFQEIRFNGSLVLGYSHVSMGEAVSLPQSFKPVGGYHIDENIQPLPKIMAMLIYLLICITISSLYPSDAYKVLVATQMPSKSHSILNDGIVRQLLKDGNEVTYIRSIEYKNAPPTLRQIDVSSNAHAIPAGTLNIKAIMDKTAKNNSFKGKRLMTTVGIKTLENKDVQKLLSDPKEHFDVVIVEFMDNDVLASFAAVFDCPLIWMSPIETNSDILRRIEAVPNPAHVPNCKSRNIAPLNFWQRVEELWSLLQSEYLYFRYFNDMETEAYNRLIAPIIAKRGRQPPPFQEIRFNGSLVLGYSHVSMGEAVSLPQSFKPVGGYHIDENIQPLPKDLKKIMDNAKDGAIYFSMGSNLKSKDWPEETKQKLLQMLGGLKQTVLWKFEEQLPNIPKNVHISNWFPQLSILAHPNCALFITHAGLLSTAESLYFGVPIIGVPAFGDQFVNIKRAVKKGFGIKVDMTYNVVEDLKTAIEEMTTNPLYRLKAKEASIIYHDRLVKPSEELSFWVRHVVLTRGATHLRSPALDLRFYQRLYLDLVAILSVIVILLYKLLRRICVYTCASKIVSTKKNN